MVGTRFFFSRLWGICGLTINLLWAILGIYLSPYTVTLVGSWIQAASQAKYYPFKNIWLFLHKWHWLSVNHHEKAAIQVLGGKIYMELDMSMTIQMRILCYTYLNKFAALLYISLVSNTDEL